MLEFSDGACARKIRSSGTHPNQQKNCLWQVWQGFSITKCSFFKKVIYSNFPTHRNNKVVGYLRRGGTGYSINRSLGMGYVDLKYKTEGQTIKDYILQGQYEIDVMGKKYKADVTLNPLFDPKKLKMKL